MRGGKGRNTVSVELDTALLSVPFQVQTRWQVITGAPCSGKSTLIDQLAALGYRTVPEGARLVMEEETCKGRSIDEVKGALTVQKDILALQLQFEGELQPRELVFLDRAIPDSLTFHRLFGIDPNEILADCFCYRYAAVFVLDPLPIVHDSIRKEDEAFARLCGEWLFRDYSALGYEVIRVPVLSIEARLAFILERVAQQGVP